MTEKEYNELPEFLKKLVEAPKEENKKKFRIVMRNGKIEAEEY
jgi:hypothetical protein